MAMIERKVEAPRAERSLGELFGDLSADMKHLVKQEVRLAKTELTHKATSVGKDLAFVGVGAACLYGGFLAFIGALIATLAQTTDLPVWGAALLVALLVLAAGAMLVTHGLSALKRENLVPEQTLATLKEDAQWAKEQVATA